MKFNLKLALYTLICLGGAWLLLTGAYSLRANQTLAIGEIGDAPFIKGFNHDEAGAPRYRWTGGDRLNGSEAVGQINFPLKPSGQVKLQLSLGTAAGKPVEAVILVNGIEVGRAPIPAGQAESFQFPVSPEALKPESFRVEIRSPSFTPGGGDTRGLGVIVREVKVSGSPAFRLPSLEVLSWAVLFTFAAGVILSQYFQRKNWNFYFGAAGGVLLLLPLLILPYVAPANLNLWYSPFLLPWAALLALGGAILAWQAEITGQLWKVWASLETGNLARNLLIGLTLVYLGYCFLVILNMDWIGHADYADNGVVARNLLRGKGFSSDYAAQFYTKYPPLPRPADTWPLLQPLLIAPFFLILGATAFAAKLPNLLLMGALAWAIFYYGSRLFNRRVALGAALLCLGAPAFFETVAYPINDLSFTLLGWLSLCSVYLAATFRPVMGATAASKSPETRADEKSLNLFQKAKHWLSHPLRRPWWLAGLWGGLFFWSKPGGGIILAAAGLWLLFQKFRNKELLLPWRALFLWGGTILVIVSPLVARNLLEFRSPFYSTEQRDAWVLKYNPPDEHIYDLYYTDPSKPLPGPVKLLEYGFDTIFRAVGVQFTKEQNDLVGGNYLALGLLGLAVLGLSLFPRRRASLQGLIFLALGLYTLFINLYWHYEIRYYLVWLPWFYIFGLYGLDWVYDKIEARNNGEISAKPVRPGKRLPLAIWILSAAFLILWLPGVLKITGEQERQGYTGTTGIVTVANWFKAHTSPGARVMSRNIWELSFHSDRQGVMVPNNASLDEIKRVMQDYGASYLELDHTNLNSNGQPDDAAWSSRRALWPLIQKKADQGGFKLIYEDKFGFVIYQLI